MTNSMGSATLIAAALAFAGSGFAQTAQAQNVQTPTVVRGAQPLTGSANGGVPAPQPMTDAQINSEALNKTQNLLRNPGERQKAMANDPKAQAADSKVKALLGPNTEKAYEISAQLMERIVAETGGDPVKMQNLMLELQGNPRALEKYLSPAQRDMIRQMASDVEKSKGMAPANGAGH